MTGPFVVVVDLDPGASNVGICVSMSTPGADPAVLEAATEELNGTGPEAVADLAHRAVGTARESSRYLPYSTDVPDAQAHAGAGRTGSGYRPGVGG